MNLEKSTPSVPDKLKLPRMDEVLGKFEARKRSLVRLNESRSENLTTQFAIIGGF